jgi:hypothetical protein
VSKVSGFDVTTAASTDASATFTDIAAATAYTTSALPVAVSAADLDADGYGDVLVSSFKGESVTLFQLSELAASGAYDAQADGLDDDGTTDIAVADSSGGTVDVFTGSCG